MEDFRRGMFKNNLFPDTNINFLTQISVTTTDICVNFMNTEERVKDS